MSDFPGSYVFPCVTFSTRHPSKCFNNEILLYKEQTLQSNKSEYMTLK